MSLALFCFPWEPALLGMAASAHRLQGKLLHIGDPSAAERLINEPAPHR